MPSIGFNSLRQGFHRRTHWPRRAQISWSIILHVSRVRAIPGSPFNGLSVGPCMYVQGSPVMRQS
jgi:hypothetical protein